jgi:hypothetical protein
VRHVRRDYGVEGDIEDECMNSTTTLKHSTHNKSLCRSSLNLDII